VKGERVSRSATRPIVLATNQAWSLHRSRLTCSAAPGRDLAVGPAGQPGLSRRSERKLSGQVEARPPGATTGPGWPAPGNGR